MLSIIKKEFLRMNESIHKCVFLKCVPKMSNSAGKMLLKVGKTTLEQHPRLICCYLCYFADFQIDFASWELTHSVQNTMGQKNFTKQNIGGAAAPQLLQFRRP